MKGFRVWSNYWKKYATEAELHMDGSVDAIFEDDSGVPHHENADIVVEFKTGLRDKNGREIHEGDIIQEEIDFGSELTDGVYTYVVEWDSDTLCYGLRGNSNSIHDLLWEVNASVEIVGNIHENPELLREEEE